MRDEKSCASGPVAQREAEKAANNSIQSKVIDLTLDDENDHRQDPGSDSAVIIVEDGKPPSSIAGPSSIPQRISKSNPSFKDTIRKTSSRPQAELVEWSCQYCTLLNPYIALQCEACDMRRPFDEREGWTCSTCTQSGNPHDFWMCQFCGTIKPRS